MPGVARITPPFSGAGMSVAEAGKIGKAKVAAEIRSLYGLPSDGYALLPPKTRAGFWKMHKSGDEAGAKQLFRETTGKSLSPFDGGTIHRRMRFKGGKRGVVYFVDDKEALMAYIKEVQGRVWWLASGWADALQALGAKLPGGVNKHSAAPGHLKVTNTASALTITASNDVKFAGSMRDMKRRIETVLNVYRTQRLDKMWDDYLAKLRRETGFKT